MKTKLHKLYKLLKPKKPAQTWALVIVFLASIAISAWGLHQNNLNMIVLRSEVLQADTNNKDVQGALDDLSNYVFHHMNTSVYQLQLVGSYNRDVAKIIQQSKKSQSNIYQQAQQSCERAGEDSSGYTTRVAQCAQDYVLAHLPASQSNTNKFPDKALYSFSFVAPTWSADLAGLSMAVAIFTGLWLIGRAFIKLIAIIIVRYRNR